jgi:hypothetical protein
MEKHSQAIGLQESPGLGAQWLCAGRVATARRLTHMAMLSAQNQTISPLFIAKKVLRKAALTRCGSVGRWRCGALQRRAVRCPASRPTEHDSAKWSAAWNLQHPWRQLRDRVAPTKLVGTRTRRASYPNQTISSRSPFVVSKIDNLRDAP